METVSKEYVTDTYDELVQATTNHASIAHYQANMIAQLKQLKEEALASKEISGSNAGARDAAWNAYLIGMIGPYATAVLTDGLEYRVQDAKLRLDIARIKVEELRLHVRITETERQDTTFAQKLADAYRD